MQKNDVNSVNSVNSQQTRALYRSAVCEQRVNKRKRLLTYSMLDIL
jgi:hypothetical protein